MPFSLQMMPRYSETEIDAQIGARGYLFYFQDVSAQHFCSFGKGNNVVPYLYGICWFLSKYRLKVLKRSELEVPMELETWVEPDKSPVRLHPSVRISQNGETCALGQMELCLANMRTGRLARLSDIEFPAGIREHCEIEVPAVRKIALNLDEMKREYTYTVRYCDLDNNRHMNNLHYVDLVMNAFSSDFYDEHPVDEIELEYLAQCYEGDEIGVFTCIGVDSADVAAVRPDGTVALKARLAFT